MSNEKNCKTIILHVPLPKKWTLDGKKLGHLYTTACDFDDCKHDETSWVSGFVVGAAMFEDEKITEEFFERKDSKQDNKEKSMTPNLFAFEEGMKKVWSELLPSFGLILGQEKVFPNPVVSDSFTDHMMKAYTLGFKQGMKSVQEEK